MSLAVFNGLLYGVDMAPAVKRAGEGDVLAAVRDLHGPTGDLYPECRGCDADGFDADYPAWPCRTAQLVYSPEEIGQVAERAKVCRIAHQAQRTEVAQSLLPDVWARQLIAQLYASPLTQIMINTPRGQR